MGKKVLKGFGISGTPGTDYDLDELKDNNRQNTKMSLNVQVWYYDLNSEDPTKRLVNPPSLKIGQMWMSVNKTEKNPK